MKINDTIKFICLVTVSTISTMTLALTETVDGITYTYNITPNGYAEITTGVAYSRAVSPAPTGHLIIPSELGGHPVTIGESAFYGCSDITDVSIPTCATMIGGSSFYGCSKLKSVKIPGNVTDIVGAAFRDCTQLNDVTIPLSVKRVGSGAFRNCTCLTNIVIPVSVTNIADRVFTGCRNLTSMTLPFVGSKHGNTGTSDSLFGYIFGKESYSGGSAVNQYYSDSQYETYYIPSALRTVVISDETCIGYGAFINCFMLTSVTLPDTIDDIGFHSFKNCSGLISIRLPAILEQDDTHSLGYQAFMGCSSLKSVIIPQGILNTRGSQFKDCTSLVSVIFPDSFTMVGGQCFSGCTSLRRLSLPESVNLVGVRAFYNCTGLSDIVFNGNAPEFENEVFQGVPSTCRIHIKKNSTGWDVPVPGTWKGFPIDYVRHNISFDANGGIVDETSREIIDGDAIGDLPLPIRDKYIFCGWFTDVSGGSVISEENMIDGDMTFYAQWENDPIHTLASEETVAEALMGVADEKLQTKIVLKKHYNAFRSWVDDWLLGHKAVKESPNAWLAYALDAPGLIAKPSAVAKEDFTFAVGSKDAEEPGKMAFDFGIDGVTIGEEAELDEVFAITGAATLEESAFTESGVTALLERTSDGKVSVSVEPPKDGNGKVPDKYFFRVKVK